MHVTFDVLAGPELWLVVLLTLSCGAAQVLSAGGMARRIGFTLHESLAVGLGMCGRAEMAFVLSSLGLSMGAIDAKVFSALIFTTFLLNLITPAGLKRCAVLIRRDSGEAEESAALVAASRE